MAKALDRNGNSFKNAPEPARKALRVFVEFYGHQSTLVSLCGFWWDGVQEEGFSTASLGGARDFVLGLHTKR